MKDYNQYIKESTSDDLDLSRFKLLTDWQDIAYFYHRDHSDVFSCLSDAPAYRYEIFKYNPQVSCLMLFDQDVSDGIPDDARSQGRAMIWGTYTVDGERKDGAFMDHVYTRTWADQEKFNEIANRVHWYRRARSSGSWWFNSDHISIKVADQDGGLHDISVILKRGPERLQTPLTYMDTLHLVKERDFYIGVTSEKEYEIATNMFIKNGLKF